MGKANRHPAATDTQQQQTPSSLRISSSHRCVELAGCVEWLGVALESRDKIPKMANGRKVGPLEASFQRVQELDIEVWHHCYVRLQSDEDGRFAWCFPALNFSSETISRQDFLNAANENCLELAITVPSQVTLELLYAASCSKCSWKVLRDHSTKVLSAFFVSRFICR